MQTSGPQDLDFSFQGLLKEQLGDASDEDLLGAQFRHVRPDLGRWVKRDPAAFIDGPNRYRWVANNPLRYSDANGLFLGPLGALGAIAGVAAGGQYGYEQGGVLGAIAGAVAGGVAGALGGEVIAAGLAAAGSALKAGLTAAGTALRGPALAAALGTAPLNTAELGVAGGLAGGGFLALGIPAASGVASAPLVPGGAGAVGAAGALQAYAGSQLVPQVGPGCERPGSPATPRLSSGSFPDRKDLTKAGRALMKHGSGTGKRQPGVFPKVPRGPQKHNNAVGQAVLEEIMRDPGVAAIPRYRHDKGFFTDYRQIDGRGARFNYLGLFEGFLHP